MLFVVFSISFLSFTIGMPLSKVNHNQSATAAINVLLPKVLAHKNDAKYLLDMFSDADPEKVAEVVTLVKAILQSSEDELESLRSASGVADSAYESAVTTYNAAVVAQTDGLSRWKVNYDQAVADYQNQVDVALTAKTTALGAKTQANNALSADIDRLTNEIGMLKQVIAILLDLPKPAPVGDLFVTDSFIGNYDQAVAHCLTVKGGGYRIASVHSDEENTLLYKIVTTEAYLGAEETSVNGVYTWNDGTPWDYTPASNDGLSSSETRIVAHRDGAWHDYGNGERRVLVICRRI